MSHTVDMQDIKSQRVEDGLDVALRETFPQLTQDSLIELREGLVNLLGTLHDEYAAQRQLDLEREFDERDSRARFNNDL